MFTGLTAANVLGVPFGTLLGQAAGWRSTFWAITVIGVARPGRHPRARADNRLRRTAAVAGGLRGELARLPVRPGLALDPRHRPRLRRHVRRLHLHRLHPHRGHRLRRRHGPVAARSSSASGSSSATSLGGKAADKNVDRTLLVVLAGLVLVLVVFALTAGNQPVTIASMVLHGRLRLRHRPGPADARHEVRQPALPPWPPAPTSAPSTSATPSAPGWAASPSPPASATPRRSGPAPASPCWAWQ